MRRCWPLHEAKNKFSEVVHLAETEGPQVVTVRGREAAVVVSASEWEKVRQHRPNLVETLRNAPLLGLSDEEIDEMFRRPVDYGRDVDLSE